MTAESATPLTGPTLLGYPRAIFLRWLLIETIRWSVQIAAVIGVFLVGFSWAAAGVFAFMYLLGATATTLCYHRYFSHRCFKTSRWFQLMLAIWGATSLQRGPVWWAAVHREHHAYADTDYDWHSPRHGFYHSYLGWLSSPKTLMVSHARVRDLTRYPELMWLENWYHIPTIVLIAGLYALGGYLESHHPQWGASGAQLIVWGVFVRITVVWHLTCIVNAFGHSRGRRNFDTRDGSTNAPRWFNWLTLGDGHHNNHHRAPGAARAGFYPGEPDPTHWLIRGLEKLGLVWDVRDVSPEVLAEGQSQRDHLRV